MRLKLPMLGFLFALGLCVPGLAWAGALPLQGDMAKLTVSDPPKPVADAVFRDENGAEMTLAAFKGKVVLLNLWATWCIPCRAEMPSLDKLAASIKDPDFKVVTVAQDRAGPEKVRKFLDELGIKNLPAYIDTTMRSARAWNAGGLPVTILIDRQGREVARLLGEADWSGHAARAVIAELLLRK